MDLHSGLPYWKLRNGEPERLPPLERDLDCEVAVVGAGVTGALCAHFLVAEGADVVVLDQREAGAGSTVASTALLQYATDTTLARLAARIGFGDAIAVYRAGLEAIDELEHIAQRELSDDCDFVRRRSLYIASSPREVTQLAGEYERRARGGLSVEFWNAHRVAQRCAFPARAAIWSDGDAEIDAFRLTRRLIQRARGRGAQVYGHTSVEAVERERGGLTLRTSRGDRVRARELILATGYESQQYLRQPVAQLKSTFALAAKPLSGIDGWPDDCLIWTSSRPYLYLRRTADGHVLIGGEDEDGWEAHALPALVPTKAKRLRQSLEAMFPGANFHPLSAWGGTFAESEDGLPYIGESPEFPGASFALGYGGNGITFATTAARMISDTYAGRPVNRAALFRFGR